MFRFVLEHKKGKEQTQKMAATLKESNNTDKKRNTSSLLHERLKTLAGVSGNVLEWYDFAAFGFFSDVIGVVFFPKDQPKAIGVMESFAVFGGAFFMRPLGGVVIGIIGDKHGRKKALEISLFLMAIATTLMGCLPTYEQIGGYASLLLLIVRMLQGLSVGGQLMSSLVFTVEGHPQTKWGLYGSCVMAAGNVGTFLGGLVAYILRSTLTNDQLITWGWRIPFLSGILILFCGIYLKYYCDDDESLPGHHVPIPTTDDDNNNKLQHHQEENGSIDASNGNDKENDFVEDFEEEIEEEVGNANSPKHNVYTHTESRPPNPLKEAFKRENRRSLLASAFVPMVWSGGFYISFVWMAIFMQDMIDPPIQDAFAANSWSLLLLGIWFPIAGSLSDSFGRKRIMTIGGVSFGILGPIMILVIERKGSEYRWVPFACQSFLSFSLGLWGAPMCAWLVESFEPKARLTSVSIGYNIAQALSGGISPFLATWLVEEVGLGAPGFLLVGLTVISMTGLWVVAPNHSTVQHHQLVDADKASNKMEDFEPRTYNTFATTSSSLELKEIT